MSDHQTGRISLGDKLSLKGPVYHDYLDFFGLIKRDARGSYWDIDERLEKKLERLHQWATLKVKGDNHEKIKKVLYDLSQKIGTNVVGETLVNKMWEYTMFDKKFNKYIEESELVQKEVHIEESKKTEPKTLPKMGTPIRKIKYKVETYDNKLYIKTRRPEKIEREFI